MRFIYIAVSVISVGLLLFDPTIGESDTESASQKLPEKVAFEPSPEDEFMNRRDAELNLKVISKSKVRQKQKSNKLGPVRGKRRKSIKLHYFGTNNKTIAEADSRQFGLLAYPGHPEPYHPPGPLHPHHPHPHAPIAPPPKPLPPSVVHRDPQAQFDHHDKIRTQDQDGNHQLYPTVATQAASPGHYDSSHGYEMDDGNYGPPKPYSYDVQAVPECALKNLYYYNLTFCLEDSHYPTDTLAWAIRQTGSFAQRLLADVTYQSADNLVDGLTKAEEEGYTYQHYFGDSNLHHDRSDQHAPPHDPEYYKKGGYICPSNIYYARPLRAMNTYGKWKVLVNLNLRHIPKEYTTNYALGHGHYKQETFTQTVRIEQCIFSNGACSYIDPAVNSRCIQKHNFQRMVAWTKEEGLHVDVFKFPIACSCHIKQPVHYYHPVPLHHVPASHVA